MSEMEFRRKKVDALFCHYDTKKRRKAKKEQRKEKERKKSQFIKRNQTWQAPRWERFLIFLPNMRRQRETKERTTKQIGNSENEKSLEVYIYKKISLMLDIRLRKRILQFFNQNLHPTIFNYYARSGI